MKNFFKTIIEDIEAIWKREEPAIEKCVEEAIAAVEPVWKTALGGMVLATVVNLQVYAASAGGTAAAKLAAQQIGVALTAAGKSASASTVNVLIEMAVQKLQAVEPATPAAG